MEEAISGDLFDKDKYVPTTIFVDSRGFHRLAETKTGVVHLEEETLLPNDYYFYLKE